MELEAFLFISSDTLCFNFFFCFIADYECPDNLLKCPDGLCGREDGKVCNGKRDCPLQSEEEDCDCMKLYSFIVTCVSSGPFSSEKMNVKFLDENLY